MCHIFDKNYKLPKNLKLDLGGFDSAMKEIEINLDKIAQDIRERKDNAMAMEFTKVIGELLKKNGVSVKITEYETENHATNKFEMLYGCSIDGLDFSEHDKVFEDKIAKLESEISYLRNTVTQYNEDCVKLEKRVRKQGKLNLNDKIKVKLTPLGAEIYYHQYDEVNKQIKERGGTELKPIMPQIDKDGYTEFQLWHFMNLYGEHIGMCKPNVINPLNIIIVE